LKLFERVSFGFLDMEFIDCLRDALLGVNTFVEGFKDYFSLS